MRIFMLGWEFPPFLAGGLGTACFGLTRALAKAGHEITFVLPKPTGGAQAEHVRLVGPEALRQTVERIRYIAESEPDTPQGSADAARAAASLFGMPATPAARESGAVAPPPGVTMVPIEAGFDNPYTGLSRPDSLGTVLQHLRAEAAGERLEKLTGTDGLGALTSGSAKVLARVMTEILESIQPDGGDGHQYGWDLFGDAQRYARLVCALGVQQQFDVIHAHDWLTFPAGLALRHLTGKPLVCHIHATEFDRSGEHINQGVYDIERAGMHGADRVIAVSRLTKSICTRRYGTPDWKVDVVYNGVDQDSVQPHAGDRIEKDDKIVLFLGRITMQKGPEYFISAAKRVLEKVENVKFVVAGSGDMAVRMIEQAAAMGIGHKVLFTGFLRGRDVDRVFQMADCYVMPSVSEPFGIAPLEAMRNDTPVIVSKQSGVSEVLTHALKVDFWDIDDMANKIVAVLKYPPLSQTLREHGAFELRRLTWEGAAEQCQRVYGRAIAEKLG